MSHDHSLLQHLPVDNSTLLTIRIHLLIHYEYMMVGFSSLYLYGISLPVENTSVMLMLDASRLCKSAGTFKQLYSSVIPACIIVRDIKLEG
jgi:hypothetical protein